jgi:hypothetical protein
LRHVSPKGSLRLREIEDFEPQSFSQRGAGNREERIQRGDRPSFPVPFRPFLKKAVLQDGKLPACVKKSRCLSAASLGILASRQFDKVFVRLGPRLFGYFLGNAKSNNRWHSLVFTAENTGRQDQEENSGIPWREKGSTTLFRHIFRLATAPSI